jgi:ABC-type phosphate transport system substrate-binding protein
LAASWGGAALAQNTTTPSTPAQAMVISGTGASFPAQVYAQWAER